MMKKFACPAMFLLFVSCALSVLFAQEVPNDPKARLRDLRYEETKITNEYKIETEKVSKAADDKLAALKAGFHKAREECLADKKDKCDRLKRELDSKIDPIWQEEKQIQDALLPEKGMNFAKPKDRKKT